MPVPWQPLEVVRVNRIMQALQDVRELPQELLFSSRIPDVPAADAEIMVRFIGRVQIADLVADDQRAVIYSNGKMSFESTTIPNLKHGRMMTQEMLNQLNAIMANGGIENDLGLFSNYENRTIDELLLGINQRKEALKIAMLLDGFSYNRLGIIMNNVSWGMPSDLKITTAVPWTDPVNGTPIVDILLAVRTALVRYGQTFDRMTMSLSALNYMTQTQDFLSRARLYLPQGVGIGANAIQLQNTEFIKNLAGSILGMKIETYDARFWSQAPDGTLASTPFLPINKVLLTSEADDGNPMAWDFANGIVTETVVSDLAPTNIIGRFGGPMRGPVAYATATSDLNPPNITYWGVARGFPRKHRLQSSAVLTVGAYTDTIPVGLPF